MRKQRNMGNETRVHGGRIHMARFIPAFRKGLLEGIHIGVEDPAPTDRIDLGFSPKSERLK